MILAQVDISGSAKKGESMQSKYGRPILGLINILSVYANELLPYFRCMQIGCYCLLIEIMNIHRVFPEVKSNVISQKRGEIPFFEKLKILL